MADEIVYCKCGFKSVKQQLQKTSGLCPKCGQKNPQAKEYYEVV